MIRRVSTLLGLTIGGITICLACGAWAQEQEQGTATRTVSAPPAATSNEGERPQAVVTDGMSPAELPGGNVSLVRGVVKRLDPVHDQLLVHAFGGGDVKINFDPRTRLLPGNSQMRSTSVPAGAVVSVDTVIENGKLFARSVRTGSSGSSDVELNGKIVRYDAGKSRLILRDPISPENVSLRVTPSTVVINEGNSASAQDLSPDMLVRVRLSALGETVKNIEILAKRGDSFVFEGRIIAVDLRSRVVAISNHTDQSVRELTLGSLDPTSLGLLREGAEVNIQAQFDGDRYNARAVKLVSENP